MKIIFNNVLEKYCSYIEPIWKFEKLSGNVTCEKSCDIALSFVSCCEHF